MAATDKPLLPLLLPLLLLLLLLLPAKREANGGGGEEDDVFDAGPDKSETNNKNKDSVMAIS
jgi:ATP-dependent Zn protease